MYNPRRLTPRECARLMGFDISGGAKMRIPVSDTPAYRQLDNSVAVSVINAVAKRMVARLLRPETVAHVSTHRGVIDHAVAELAEKSCRE